MLKLAVDGCVEVYRERVGQVEYGSVGERQQLRARLACNSFQGGGGHISAEMRVENHLLFQPDLISNIIALPRPHQWYLDTVYPSQFQPQRAVHAGSISTGSWCLTSPRGRRTPAATVTLATCTRFANPHYNPQVRVL